MESKQQDPVGRLINRACELQGCAIYVSVLLVPLIMIYAFVVLPVLWLWRVVFKRRPTQPIYFAQDAPANSRPDSR